MSIKYNSNYFYDVPDQPRCPRPEPAIPDYIQFDRPYERTPEVIGVLSFCGERGPAGVTNLAMEANSEALVSATGTQVLGQAITVVTRSDEVTD